MSDTNPVTDRFDEPWWNLLQTVGWVGFRERILVCRFKDGVTEDCLFQELDGKDDETWADDEDDSPEAVSEDSLVIEFARRYTEALCTFDDAADAVIAALRKNRLRAVAFQNWRTVEIPMARWVLHPLFWDGPKYSAPHEPRTIPWQEIRFPREQVLMRWPEVSESCLRDGAPAPAEGNTNVEPPESSLLTFRAPADMPDPFGQQWWSLMQVLAWGFLGNRTVVRNVGPQELFESAYTRKDLRFLGRNGACYPHFADAEDAVIEALQAGRLTATGVANGEGDRKEIPALLWLDLEFRDDPISARPKDFSRTAVTNWHALRFQRKDVLAVWPDPLEQKTSTIAEGNANVEPSENETPDERHARITARHQELKAARDPHPTKTVAKEEGISEVRVRQLMNKAKANEPSPPRSFPKAR